MQRGHVWLHHTRAFTLLDHSLFGPGASLIGQLAARDIPCTVCTLLCRFRFDGRLGHEGKILAGHTIHLLYPGVCTVQDGALVCLFVCFGSAACNYACAIAEPESSRFPPTGKSAVLIHSSFLASPLQSGEGSAVLSHASVALWKRLQGTDPGRVLCINLHLVHPVIWALILSWFLLATGDTSAYQHAAVRLDSSSWCGVW
jgi:hypothetical protein